MIWPVASPSITQANVAHTAKFRPWRIETAISFRSESKAMAFEKYLKSGSDREFARPALLGGPRFQGDD